MNRRKFIKLGAITTFSAVAVSSLSCDRYDYAQESAMRERMMGGQRMGGRYGGMQENSSSQLPEVKTDTLSKQLPIPALSKPTVINGVSHHNLTIKKTTHQFFPNVNTTTFAIDASYLGKTIKMKRGERVSLNYTNKLDEKTTIHGHGMHLPANVDGGAHQIIQPNQTFKAAYTVNQKACTNWYHPHLMGKTADQVYMGMAGLLIVEDDEIQALDLPKDYGVDDIPLVLQDRFFQSNGDFRYSPNMREVMMGYVGDYPIANGAIRPYVDLEAKEIRFRILNASNSSVYNLKFSDNRSFKQIGVDNSLLQKPVQLNNVILSPAERAEIVVDLTLDMGKSIQLVDTYNNHTFLTLNINKKASKITKVPNTLTSLEFYKQSQAIRTRKFVLSGRMGSFYINNKQMDMKRIDEKIPMGDVEIWEIRNDMMMTHNFHIHATHFTILKRNGSAENVAENEKGYKDVVRMPGGSSATIMVKMTDYKDPNGAYMYHCHFLEHEDRGMMGQFAVV